MVCMDGMECYRLKNKEPMNDNYEKKIMRRTERKEMRERTERREKPVKLPAQKSTTYRCRDLKE